MRVFAIADPHLSKAQPKPMNIFGGNWQGHPEIFFEKWREVVRDEDLVLIPGDISWAMKLGDALLDLNDIAALPGKKVIMRGNHDYWWSAIGKVRKILPENMYALQNDALCIDGVVIAGTRGWTCPGTYGFTEEDQKIYVREIERLNLSLQAAKKLRGDKFVVMLHFPPTNVRLEPSGFSELLLKAKPDAVVFGHLHGEKVALPKLGGTDVHFVAADALGFKPKQIF
jgi:uncharacterized protein